MMPALLNSTFSLPNAFSAAATMCSQSAAFETSALHGDGVREHASAVSRAAFSFTSTQTTEAPSRAKSSADLPPDAAAGAGDECDFVLESHILSKYRLRSQSVTALS